MRSRLLAAPHRLLVIGAVLILVLGGLAYAGSRWTTRQALAVADTDARQTARSHVGLLASELQKFRLLPLVLSENPEMGPALSGDNQAARARLDATLELLASRTDAAA